MAKGAPEAQQGGGENSLDFLWMVVLILAAVVLIWYYGKVYIAEGVFWVYSYEIMAIKFVLGFFDTVRQFFFFPPSDLKVLNDWSAYISKNYGAEVDFQVITNLSAVVGHYIRYPVMLILTVFSAILYFGSVSQRFRVVFDMKRLRIVENKNWPHITPVVGIDLVAQPLDKAPWAIALNPMQFCKKLNLTQSTVKNGKPAITLKKGAANRVLSLQLGARWQGVEVLPEYLQALVAIFAARMNGEKLLVERLMAQISASAVAGATKFNFSGSRELLTMYVNTKPVQKIMKLHGYATGVLASLLAAAREAGVLATAEFLWLKTIDRKMWYMLNSVGRPTAVAEISGAFAHWLAERKLGLPLMVPMVDEAVRGLEAAFADILYKPDED